MSKFIYSQPFPLTWVKWMGDYTFPIVLPYCELWSKGWKQECNIVQGEIFCVFGGHLIFINITLKSLLHHASLIKHFEKILKCIWRVPYIYHEHPF
jgi:hypothetical protein